MVSAEDVTGPYDVIARAEAATVDELGKMVVSRVQMIDGITRTLTCPVVHLVGRRALRRLGDGTGDGRDADGAERQAHEEEAAQPVEQVEVLRASWWR